jgi:hypothetical protein
MYACLCRLLGYEAERLLEASYLPWLAGWEAYGRQQHHLCKAHTAAMARQHLKSQMTATKDVELLSKLGPAADKQLKRQLHHLRQLQGLIRGPSPTARQRLDGAWRKAASTEDFFRRQEFGEFHEQLLDVSDEEEEEEGSDGGSSRDMSPGELTTSSDTSSSDEEDSKRRNSSTAKPSNKGLARKLARSLKDSRMESVRAAKRREKRVQRGVVEEPAAKEARREAAAQQILQQVLQQLQPQEPSQHQQQATGPGASTAAAAAAAAAAAGGAPPIDWSAWVPWFNPGCPLCVQEVQDLLAQQQQQQQQQAAAAGGARGEVPLCCRPGYHPWTAEAATSAAPAAAAGSNQGASPSDGPTTTTTSSSSSSGAPTGPWLLSCYWSWPVPWSCAYRYRRLLWRLLARVKPGAAAFYQQEASMCAHVADHTLWRKVVSGSTCCVHIAC